MADDLFSSPLRRLFWTPSAVFSDWRAGSAGQADWIETPSAHILKINTPGLGRDEVKVRLEEGNVLHVRGEAAAAVFSKDEPPAKEAVWHVAERGKGEFSRRFALPDDVKADQIKAHVENGVLTVVAPKETSPPKPKSRTIAVSSKL